LVLHRCDGGKGNTASGDHGLTEAKGFTIRHFNPSPPLYLFVFLLPHFQPSHPLPAVFPRSSSLLWLLLLGGAQSYIFARVRHSTSLCTSIVNVHLFPICLHHARPTPRPPNPSTSSKAIKRRAPLPCPSQPSTLFPHRPPSPLSCPAYRDWMTGWRTSSRLSQTGSGNTRRLIIPPTVMAKPRGPIPPVFYGQYRLTSPWQTRSSIERTRAKSVVSTPSCAPWWKR